MGKRRGSPRKTTAGAKRGRPTKTVEEFDEEVSFHFTDSQLKRLLTDTAKKAATETATMINNTRSSSRNNASQSDSDSETSDNESSDKPVIHATGNLPLDLHVTPRQREKILSDKFIELGDLLEKDPTKLDDRDVTFRGSKMVAKAKPNVVKTFDEWEMAWDIFMTVYSRKEENAPKLKSLIKYRSNVKDIHDRKGRWIFYDTQFRRLKELLGNELSWDTLHNEIYLKSMGPATKSEKSDQYNPGRSTSTQNSHLRVSGYCWNYGPSGQYIHVELNNLL